jgi:hypothetical protein
MIESELRTQLRAVGADPDQLAEQRAWEIVRGAYGPTPKRTRRLQRARRMTVTTAVAVAALTIVVLTVARPPREALGRWLREAIGLAATPRLRPMLAGLPGGGQLLINSAAGPWIVSRDGHRRYLGRYTAAAWSPHSLYVVAWRGRELDALSPHGRRQWTLDSAATISAARWSPDGYRIAYLTGQALWVVAGDSTGRHELRVRVGSVPPAWQPGTGRAHRIAFVDRAGAIEVLDADSGVALRRMSVPETVRALAWSPSGRQLLAVCAHRLALYDAQGHLLSMSRPSGGQTLGGAAFAPRGRGVAVIIRGAAGNSVGLMTGSGRGLHHPAKILFSARAWIDAINWSPDNRWLLASSPSADQWIFIRTRSPVRLAAVSRIAAQFAAPRRPDGFPILGGWQAPPPSAPSG